MNLPFHTFLKLLVSISAVIWSLLSIGSFFGSFFGNFFNRHSLLQIKFLAHGLTVSTLTLYLITYGMEQKYFPLTNAAEGFIFIAWLYSLSFLFLSLPLKTRSLDIFLAPIPTVLILLGLTFIEDFKDIVTFSSNALSYLDSSLILFSILGYFYAFILSLLYKRIFKEIKNKESLFLTLKIPNLKNLRKTIEIFLILGNLAFLGVLTIYFILVPLKVIPNYFIPETLPFGYLLTGTLFLFLLIFTKLGRIGHEQLFFSMSFGFLLILLHLFNIL